MIECRKPVASFQSSFNWTKSGPEGYSLSGTWSMTRRKVKDLSEILQRRIYCNSLQSFSEQPELEDFIRNGLEANEFIYLQSCEKPCRGAGSCGDKIIAKFDPHIIGADYAENTVYGSMSLSIFRGKQYREVDIFEAPITIEPVVTLINGSNERDADHPDAVWKVEWDWNPDIQKASGEAVYRWLAPDKRLFQFRVAASLVPYAPHGVEITQLVGESPVFTPDSADLFVTSGAFNGAWVGFIGKYGSQAISTPIKYGNQGNLFPILSQNPPTSVALLGGLQGVGGAPPESPMSGAGSGAGLTTDICPELWGFSYDHTDDFAHESGVLRGI